MTDALFPMDEAPKDGVSLLALLAGGAFFVMDEWQTYQSDRGFLPLPADASSKAVAECAGKWLSVCSDEDVAAVIREALNREGVRTALETASNWPEATRHNAAATNNSFVAPVLRALIQEPTDD